MPAYKAPLRDIQFVLKELLDSESHFASLPGQEDTTPDLVDAILDGGARFAEDVVAPLNLPGDEQGCGFSHGQVTTPDGYKEAYHQYADAGWIGLNTAVEEGGQGLPGSIGTAVGEMIGSASWSFSMYTGLSLAPVSCLLNGGSAEQKQRFIPKILSGEWAGTMCLTEAHAGSDVGMCRTKAVANSDGTYNITGTKIFISGGEQDITDNIIHAVLARLEGAPEGTAGISLFIIPKIWVNEDGSLGDANNVSCGSIEKKMGLKAQATCVMNFDGARGILLGEEDKGLKLMFKLMNTARLGTAMQGLSMGEASFQGALAYAQDRLQMRAISGTKNPDGPADPIIVHPDVRRMLMTQKAFVEGSRALIYWLAQLVDKTACLEGDEADAADKILQLLTPVAKAFCTETGVEVCALGLQTFGGHGYIHEHGMEQIIRDGRISTVYEGTTGIQALDLVGRKVMGSGGELLRNFTKQIYKYCQAHEANEAMAAFVEPLSRYNQQWGDITGRLGELAMEDPDNIGAGSVDFTMYSGYVAMAYMWAQMAELAQSKIAAGSDDPFYKTKLATAKFYFSRVLPRAAAHAEATVAGADSVMSLSAEEFSF
ncbi:MAG: acyl-CoA dehydrogenase C-terminal domain-containing protein [Pseudomonadales bacterium]